MTSTQRVWISQQAYQRLQQELATLRQLCAAGPGAGDDDENTAAIQRARRSRIQQIHDLLINAVVGEDPPDDGVAEPGMVITIRYDDTGDTETFLLGVRGAEYGDMEVYSVRSPLGAAIVGARPGQQRTYTSPGGTALTVTLLKAVPYGVHAADLN
jgi:transcription elongation factor GreA